MTGDLARISPTFAFRRMGEGTQFIARGQYARILRSLLNAGESGVIGNSRLTPRHISRLRRWYSLEIAMHLGEPRFGARGRFCLRTPLQPIGAEERL
jgi:hypothetical protein